MSEESRSCPSCGAHASPDASVCDLCGTPIEDPEPSDEETTDAADEVADSPEEEASSEASSASDSASGEAPDEAVYCYQCGWENPPGANFCSQCGTELQDLSADAAPEDTRPVAADLPTGPADDTDAEPDDTDAELNEQAEMGQQILLVVGTALLLVLGLFFATQWSQQYEWGDGDDANSPPAAAEQQSGGAGASSPSGAQATGPAGSSSASGAPSSSPEPTALQTLVEKFGGSVEGPVASKIDSLRALLGEASGDDRRQLRAELSRLYVGAGVPGRAALVQSQLADQTERVEDRRRAANLLYKWMRQVEQQQGRAQVADVARHVAEAYAAVVEARPQDLDARTRMGEAYLLTNNPMKGIQTINQVLEDDSTFVPARFQKGLALLQINRLDQAVSQFERVMMHASQDDPFYQQAKKAIEVIRKRAGSSEGRTSVGGRRPSGS